MIKIFVNKENIDNIVAIISKHYAIPLTVEPNDDNPHSRSYESTVFTQEIAWAVKNTPIFEVYLYIEDGAKEILWSSRDHNVGLCTSIDELDSVLETHFKPKLSSTLPTPPTPSQLEKMHKCNAYAGQVNIYLTGRGYLIAKVKKVSKDSVVQTEWLIDPSVDLILFNKEINLPFSRKATEVEIAEAEEAVREYAAKEVEREAKEATTCTEKIKEETTVEESLRLISQSMLNLLRYKNHKYGNSALAPLDIFGSKAKAGPRLDEKLARVKNSTVLSKNDVADCIGYLYLICVEKGWTDFEDQKD